MAPQDRDQLDRLLDGALQQYGSVEPRTGLEGRVLARLALATAVPTRARVWAWAVAGAVAMILAMWIGIGHRSPKTPVAHVQPGVSRTAAQRTAVVMPPVEFSKPRRVRSRETATPVTQAKATEPRLQQFPSSRPLSQQEQLLIAYVTDFPKQAAEVAQEQTEREKEIEAMYPATKPDSDSNQER